MPPNRPNNAHALSDFRQIADTFSTAKYFSITIPQFKGLSASNSPVTGLAPVLSAYARSFGLPGAVVNAKPVTIQHGLPPINISDTVVFSPWTITFVDDDKLSIRKFFETWLGVIRSWDGHYYNPPASYKAHGSEASILDDNRMPIHVYEFFGMFPTDISPIVVGQDNNNLIEFSVTFYYDFYKLSPIKNPEAATSTKATELPSSQPFETGQYAINTLNTFGSQSFNNFA